MAEPFSPGYLVAGRYRIEREIGRGGMAVVHLARDEVHDRHVAVKVLAPELSSVPGSRRFLTEIRTTAGLGHPHILPLIDSGDEGGSLFYILPFVRGESLRDRMEREGTLPVEEVLRLGTALAGALAHAHAEGVIHRDVKPGNILLDQTGNPYLADFGIARALSDRGTELRTTTGYLLGTPQYMSPEQLSGEREVDESTDVYALGCVLYEMLVGEPPFNAASPEAIIAAHLFKDPPSLRTRRSDVPPAVDELLRSALAREPDERPRTASEFAEFLDDARMAVRTSGRAGMAWVGFRAHWASRRNWRRLAYVVGAVMLLGFIGLAVREAVVRSDPGASLDTTRYAVMPFEVDSTLVDMVPPDILLHDALDRWEGITVVDGLRLRDHLSRFADPSRLTREEALTVALAMDAGRLVDGRATRVGDSVRVEALLLDATSGGTRLNRVVTMMAPDGAGMDRAVERTTETLLFGAEAAVGVDARPLRTTSAPARRQYGLGQAALVEWNLLEAERRFTEAARLDHDFAQAVFWKAQVMSWLGRPAREWGADATRALEAATDLAPRLQLLASALVAMADGRHPEACRDYETLRTRDPGDFAARFGLGECRARDLLVLPDSSSRTGWSFRASGHAAAEAYRTALESLPSSYRAFGAGSLDLARSKLYAEGTGRAGQGAAPESRGFIGAPEWRGDTLAFVAVPFEEASSFVPDSAAMAEALVRQRRKLLDLASAWVQAFPESADALYTLAAARELVGDPSAVETYAQARSLAEDARVWGLIGAAEASLRVRLSLPLDLPGLERAVALADSVLESGFADARRAETLIGIAVLLGRPNAAAALARQAVQGSDLAGTPPEVGREVDALLVFAAVGAPVDSIRALEARAEERIRQTIPGDETSAARRSLLEQPALLAFPEHTLEYLADGAARSSEGRAIEALAAGDPETALSTLGPTRPGLSWDIVLARANVLVAAGRRDGALEALAARFDALSADDPQTVNTVARLGALVRAAALRAELEDQLGSADLAVAWARAVRVVWGGGEAAVGPILERMRDILDAHGEG